MKIDLHSKQVKLEGRNHLSICPIIIIRQSRPMEGDPILIEAFGNLKLCRNGCSSRHGSCGCGGSGLSSKMGKAVASGAAGAVASGVAAAGTAAAASAAATGMAAAGAAAAVSAGAAIGVAVAASDGRSGCSRNEHSNSGGSNGGGGCGRMGSGVRGSRRCSGGRRGSKIR